jgi:hypothetical protein
MENCKVKLEGEGIPKIKKVSEEAIASLVAHFWDYTPTLGLYPF